MLDGEAKESKNSASPIGAGREIQPSHADDASDDAPPAPLRESRADRKRTLAIRFVHRI
jgi:hypothetical protein